MGENFNDRVDHLRRQSRILLAYIEKNSKTLRKDIKKLQQNVAAIKRSNNIRRCNNAQVMKNFNSWKQRNDSSGVNAALCSEYIYNCPKSGSASEPKMACKKLLIPSKKYSDDLYTRPCNKTLERKHIRSCYCSSEITKIKHRSPQTQHKLPNWCDQCRNWFSTVTETIHEDNEKKIQSPSISSETLRRIQRINYIPRSQFLRNVQTKVSVLHTTSLDNYYPKLPQPSTLNVEQGGGDIYENQSKIVSDKHARCTKPLSTSYLSLNVPANSEIDSDEAYDTKTRIQKLNKGVQVGLENLKPNYANKKTNTIKGHTIRAINEVPTSESSTKEDNFHQDNDANADCQCTCRYKAKRLSKKANVNNVNENRICSKRCPRCCWRGTRIGEEEDELQNRFDDGDQDVRDLRKFRDQNYFDTHGSSQTLLSCRLSGSLRQTCTNNRLFPEAMRRNHRRSLAPTMLPWATVQKKRVHYFPKFIVPREKIVKNTNYRKKRCQSCPLTGHAIDRGVLKAPPPLDSLALTHQKRML